MPDMFELAAGLLEIALSPEASGGALAIMMGDDGSIRIREADGWTCHSLQADTGARAVYRIAGSPDRVRLEATDGIRRCLLESRRRRPLHRSSGPASSTTGTPESRILRAISGEGRCVTTTCPAQPSSSSSDSAISRPMCGIAVSTNWRLLP